MGLILALAAVQEGFKPAWKAAEGREFVVVWKYSGIEEEFSEKGKRSRFQEDERLVEMDWKVAKTFETDGLLEVAFQKAVWSLKTADYDIDLTLAKDKPPKESRKLLSKDKAKAKELTAQMEGQAAQLREQAEGVFVVRTDKSGGIFLRQVKTAAGGEAQSPDSIFRTRYGPYVHPPWRPEGYAAGQEWKSTLEELPGFSLGRDAGVTGAAKVPVTKVAKLDGAELALASSFTDKFKTVNPETRNVLEEEANFEMTMSFSREGHPTALKRSCVLHRHDEKGAGTKVSLKQELSVRPKVEPKKPNGP